jgi:hypothetical protein
MHIHKLNTTHVIHIVADPQYIRQDYVVYGSYIDKSLHQCLFVFCVCFSPLVDHLFTHTRTHTDIKHQAKQEYLHIM